MSNAKKKSLYQSEDWVNRCLPKLEAETSIYLKVSAVIGLLTGKIILGAAYATGAVIALELLGYL